MEELAVRREQYLISTDKSLLDAATIHSFLSQRSYWAQARPLEVVQRSIDHSLCFGLYGDGKQIGFARVVTDFATFAWLCDVFVLEEHRGLGLSKWLVETVVAHPALAGIKRIMLATRDAHGLYARYGGFVPLQGAERWMERG